MSIAMRLSLILVLVQLSGKIMSQVPATWTVNSAAFQYQMSMTCKANEACVNLADTNNYIAAFVGTQCRGVVKTKVAFGTSKLGLLTIKSNSVTGEKVKFKIYKAGSNVVLNSLDSVIFTQGTQMGALANPFFIYTNHVPTDIALSSYTVAENSALASTLATMSTVDPDAGSTFNYSLTTGQPENSQFTIMGNQLLVNANYDYETDPLKIIQIYVDDNGGCSYIETFTVNVMDRNDAPTALYLTSPMLSDHQQLGSLMGKFSTDDQDVNDTHAYTLVAGAGATDNAQFYIQNDTLYNVFQLDYTAQSVYHIRARTTDPGALFFENTFTLTVTNVNDAPTNVLISNYRIDENQPVGTPIGTLTVTDNDLADTHTLTIEHGLDSAAVSLSGNLLLSNVSYNFEQKDTFYVKIRATDPFAAYYIKTFTIVVNDINDVPSDVTLSKDSIQELSPVNTMIGNFSSMDEDTNSTHSYSLTPGSGDSDNNLFVISGNQLLSKQIYIFTHQTYSVRVSTTDNGGLAFEKIFLIKVYNRNEAPLGIVLDTMTVIEDNEQFHHVSKIRTIDRDNPDSFTYALASGVGDDDNGEFLVQNNNLVILGKTNAAVKDLYRVRLKTTDFEGLSFEKSMDITITDLKGNTIPLPSTNYISPNGDGKNDFWKVENVDIYKEFALQVFDQFGHVIYETPNNYNNEFDGTYRGNALPTGNYYYVFKNNKISYKGNITIVN